MLLQQDAVEAGVSPNTIAKVTQQINLIPSVIALDRAQPEFVNTFFDYYYQRVDALKIKLNREALLKNLTLLNELETQYAVPKATLVAFWCMETNYGSYQGNTDTFSTFATPAYEGRRASFFREQLIDAMRMIDNRQANTNDLDIYLRALGQSRLGMHSLCLVILSTLLLMVIMMASLILCIQLQMRWPLRQIIYHK